jgi:predicted XRE-type DNA-binding protein
MKHKIYRDSKSLAKALKLPPSEGARIEMRVDLAIAISRVVERKKLTHVAAAKTAQVGRTVMTAILNGNTLHISTERLITIAQNLGLTVTLKVA